MAKTLDKELEEYKKLIGAKRYIRQYNTLYNQIRQGRTKRYSGKKYENSPDKLQSLKEKYKNDVTKEMIEEMFI